MRARIVGLICLALVPLAVPIAGPALAAGGFGSVWVSSVTSTSITIDWTHPNGSDYRYPVGETTHNYRVCYKVSGDWVGACNGGTELYTQQKPYTITGLSPATTYKIKVFANVEEDEWLWGWGDLEYTKVGTLTQATSASPPPAQHHGNLVVTATGPGSISVDASWSHPGDFAFVRVCYKKTWLPISLCARCSEETGPPTEWGTSTPNRGWLEVAPPGTNNLFTFNNLDDCRQYKLVAYGFFPNNSTGVPIGEVKAHTGAACKTVILAEELTDNHEVAVDGYLGALASQYGGTSDRLFSLLAARFPNLEAEFDTLAADGDSIAAGPGVGWDTSWDLATLLYLSEAHADSFDLWQSEPTLQQDSLSLELYLQRTDPSLLDHARRKTATGLGDTVATYRGRLHRSLGSALLQLTDTVLVVSNGSPSGSDGVSIDLGSVQRFDLHIAPLHLPANSALRFASLAGADTTASARVRRAAADSGHLEVAYDPGSGVTALRVDALLGNRLIRSLGVPVGGSLATLGERPPQMGAPAESICFSCIWDAVVDWVSDAVDWAVEHLDLSSEPVMMQGATNAVGPSVHWTLPVQGRIRGDTEDIVFDHVRVHPLNGTFTDDAITRMILTSSNLPSITLRNEASDLPTAVSTLPGPPAAATVRNRPNPFNPHTSIPYTLREGGWVTVRVYDATGRLVRTLENRSLTAGIHTARWDGRSDQGARVRSGTYFARIRYPDGTQSEWKMTLMR